MKAFCRFHLGLEIFLSLEVDESPACKASIYYDIIGDILYKNDSVLGISDWRPLKNPIFLGS